ncbi:hypothetical protein [Pseudophaeobacter sp.]|uniref:hypothetical protein n=1 Tax=Pseudophaeobacter sp. TaxID=1971739 RepID=UPI003297966D
MKARTRFLKSVISAAKSETTEMPWSRGATRQAQIAARRNGTSSQPAAQHLKSA